MPVTTSHDRCTPPPPLNSLAIAAALPAATTSAISSDLQLSPSPAAMMREDSDDCRSTASEANITFGYARNTGASDGTQFALHAACAPTTASALPPPLPSASVSPALTTTITDSANNGAEAGVENENSHSFYGNHGNNYRMLVEDEYAQNSHSRLLKALLTPARKRTRADRFIPQRPISGQLDLSTRFRLLQSSQTTSSCSTPPSTTITTTTTVTAPVTDADIRKANAARTYTSLLRTELFGNCDAEATSDIVSSDAPRTPRKCARVLSFTPTTPRTPKRALGSDDSSYAPHSPLSAGGRRILRRQLESPGAQRVRQRQREIGRVPIRILDAPKLTDDFYFHLLHWNSRNQLAVALDDSVYVWSGDTQSAQQLCSLSEAVTSLQWSPTGAHLALATCFGRIHIYDAAHATPIHTFTPHSPRIAVVAWHPDGRTLIAGAHNGVMTAFDVRRRAAIARVRGHAQEVCGLEWSTTDEWALASGGNDNRVLLWDARNMLSTTTAATATTTHPMLLPAAPRPVHIITGHTAAVKAIAWHPRRRGVLVTGGGAVDRTLRVWDVRGRLGGEMAAFGGGVQRLLELDTGSQICNVAWSPTRDDELFSTHGFSHNQVSVWRYDERPSASSPFPSSAAPRLHPIATLTGHTHRVVYLACAPGGDVICTGAGDETLRFWSMGGRASSADGRDCAKRERSAKLWDETGMLGKLR